MGEPKLAHSLDSSMAPPRCAGCDIPGLLGQATAVSVPLAVEMM